MAKYTEEERHAMQESDGFFDFENGADDMSPLEPEEPASNGRHHEEVSNLAQALDDKIKFSSAGHAQLPPAADPAILNVMRFPPGAGMMPPFMPQVAPLQLPPGMLQRLPNYAAPPGLNDPAIMSMGQIPPQLQLLQEQQAFFRQNPPMMSQPPPPPQGLKQGGARTLEDIERQLLSEQNNVRHNQQQQQQHQYQQQGRYNQQQQNHNFQQQQQQHHQQQQHSHQYQQQRPNQYLGNNFGNSGEKMWTLQSQFDYRTSPVFD